MPWLWVLAVYFICSIAGLIYLHLLYEKEADAELLYELTSFYPAAVKYKFQFVVAVCDGDIKKAHALVLEVLQRSEQITPEMALEQVYQETRNLFF